MNDLNYYTVPDLVELLGIGPSKIHRLLEDQHLAAVKIDGVLQIPEAFIVDGAPLSSLRGTLVSLSDAGFSVEESVEWLFTENEQLNGREPIAVLRSGQKSAVRRAVQVLG